LLSTRPAPHRADADPATTFSNERELAKLVSEWPISRLIDAWDSFAGVAPFQELKPIKKFTDRKSAVARIWAAIPANIFFKSNPVSPPFLEDHHRWRGQRAGVTVRGWLSCWRVARHDPS
jgi:hypothetical protein